MFGEKARRRRKFFRKMGEQGSGVGRSVFRAVLPELGFKLYQKGAWSHSDEPNHPDQACIFTELGLSILESVKGSLESVG
jgi:hypothetical protein